MARSPAASAPNRPRPAQTPEEETKTVASLLRGAISQLGFKDVKECARSIKVPYDLLNKVLGGHLPKDAQLADYARKLGLDERELLLAAYREKAPDAVKPYFNAIAVLDSTPPDLRELLDLVDTSTPAQRGELLELARLLRGKPRERCERALALVRLYHGLEGELASHFDALVVMALRQEPSDALEAFREAAGLPAPESAPRHRSGGTRSQTRSSTRRSAARTRTSPKGGTP